LPEGETKPIDFGAIGRAADPEASTSRTTATSSACSRSGTADADAAAARRADHAASEPLAAPATHLPVRAENLDRRNRLGEAFHPLDTSLAVANPVDGAGELQDRFAREHLARAGERAEARGKVESAAAVAVRDGDGLARVEPDADAARETAPR
jgi:hypothetical protein